MNRVDLPGGPPGSAKGWYPDPLVPELLRYWDGGSWTDLTYLAPVQDADGRIRPFHPLSRGERPARGRTIGLTLVYLAPPVVASGVLAAWMTSEPESFLTGRSGAWLLWLLYFAVLARRVDYRWFDTLFQLIPFYGFVWAVTIAWRNAKLPYRDWSPRLETVQSDPAWQAHLAAASEAAHIRPDEAASGVVEGDAQRP